MIRTNQEKIKSLTLADLPIGTEIFYNGDMANQSGFGRIINHKSDKWGNFVDIDMEDGRKINNLPALMFRDKYLGNGSTRFVTKAAYQAWRQSYIDAMARR